MHIALKRITRLIFFFLVCPLALFAASSQQDPRTVADRLHYFNIAAVLNQSDATKKSQLRDSLADVMGTHSDALIYYALPARTVADSFKEFLQAIENTREDEQVRPGGGPSSIVSKTGPVTLLGFSLDTADPLHTVDQSVAALRVNADGMSRFLTNQEVIPLCAVGDSPCASPGWLRNLEFAASFNVTKSDSKSISGTTQPRVVVTTTTPPADPDNPDAVLEPIETSTIQSDAVEFSVDSVSQGFANTTVRYTLFNRRDLRSFEYGKKWLQSFQPSNDLAKSADREYWNYVKLVLQQMQQTGMSGRLVRESGETDQYTAWVSETREKLRNAPETKSSWEMVLQEQLDSLLEKMRGIDRDFDSRSMDLARMYIRRITAQRNTASMADTSPALAIEYSYSQPALQPGIHTSKLAYAFSPGAHDGSGNSGTVTLNIGVDFYHGAVITPELGKTSHWKGGQVALQFDRRLGPPNSVAQLTMAGTYQYLAHPVVNVPVDAVITSGIGSAAPGDQLLIPKGPQFVAEVTLTIRTARSGLKIPVGFSWSNRTDLSIGSEYRGHIGLTFDSIPLILLHGQ